MSRVFVCRVCNWNQYFRDGHVIDIRVKLHYNLIENYILIKFKFNYNSNQIILVETDHFSESFFVILLQALLLVENMTVHTIFLKIMT